MIFTYVKKLICPFLFERARPSTRALQKWKSSWCFRGRRGWARLKMTSATGEADELSWKHMEQRTPPMKSDFVSKSSDFACAYASGTGQWVRCPHHIYVGVVLLLKSKTPVSGCGLGYAQPEHQWTFLVALGAIETPTIRCTYAELPSVYVVPLCDPYRHGTTKSTKTPWDSSIMINICRLTWHVKLRPLLKKKTPTRKINQGLYQTALLHVHSDAILLDFQYYWLCTIRRAVMDSWTEGCDEVSWSVVGSVIDPEIAAFVSYFQVFFSLMMMLRDWYVLHEKLLTERSLVLVTFWLNKQLQNVKVWSLGWPPKAWFGFVTTEKSLRKTNPPVIKHCKFYFQLNRSMEKNSRIRMEAWSLYGWRWLVILTPTRLRRKWSIFIHFWLMKLYMINRVSSILGTKNLGIKTCRKASSSEQLLGVVVVDWFTVHFAPRVWFLYHVDMCWWCWSGYI